MIFTEMQEQPTQWFNIGTRKRILVFLMQNSPTGDILKVTVEEQYL